MKAFLFFFAVCGCWVARGEAPTTVRDETKALLRSSFSQLLSAEPIHAQVQAEPAKDGDVIVLDRMTIVESQRRRDVEKAITDRIAAIREERFAASKGGLLKTKQIGKVQMNLGLWPELFDNAPGKVGTQDIMLRVDILRLKW
jgi:hypothetical protein